MRADEALNSPPPPPPNPYPGFKSAASESQVFCLNYKGVPSSCDTILQGTCSPLPTGDLDIDTDVDRTPVNTGGLTFAGSSDLLVSRGGGEDAGTSSQATQGFYRSGRGGFSGSMNSGRGKHQMRYRVQAIRLFRMEAASLLISGTCLELTDVIL